MVRPSLLWNSGPTPWADTEADTVWAALVPAVLPLLKLNVVVAFEVPRLTG